MKLFSISLALVSSDDRCKHASDIKALADRGLVLVEDEGDLIPAAGDRQLDRPRSCHHRDIVGSGIEGQCGKARRQRKVYRLAAGIRLALYVQEERPPDKAHHFVHSLRGQKDAGKRVSAVGIGHVGIRRRLPIDPAAAQLAQALIEDLIDDGEARAVQRFLHRTRHAVSPLFRPSRPGWT